MNCTYRSTLPLKGLKVRAYMHKRELALYRNAIFGITLADRYLIIFMRASRLKHILTLIHYCNKNKYLSGAYIVYHITYWTATGQGIFSEKYSIF